jgi:hypothetical protein
MALPPSTDGARQRANEADRNEVPRGDQRRRSVHSSGRLPRRALPRTITSRSARESNVAPVDRGWPETGWITAHRSTSVLAGFRFSQERSPLRGALVSKRQRPPLQRWMPSAPPVRRHGDESRRRPGVTGRIRPSGPTRPAVRPRRGSPGQSGHGIHPARDRPRPGPVLRPSRRCPGQAELACGKRLGCQHWPPAPAEAGD